MTDIALRPGNGATSGDNSFTALQAKLLVLIKLMDDGATELESVYRSMKANATRCEGAAGDIENAEFDPEFIDLTNHTATALGGATVQARHLMASANELAENTRQARQTHAKKYGPLDTVRSGRRHKTPKPGVFVR
ncbi:conjugal transfer protein TraB [Streptomyces sp. NPDC056975]|uniref:conjugal transfer protein TraB n=1 Tax=Streptomyces sp. NPDC056975 TaxID=3345985 RepID=UPI00363E6A15